jgi:hypothetical protein
MPMPPLLWAEFSIQFLIPAIFLVIWALNQVFGRAEAPPPPIRERAGGPRPIPPPGPSRAPQSGTRAPRGTQAGGGGPRSSPSGGGTPGRYRDSSRSSGRAGRSGSRPAPAPIPEPTPHVSRVGEITRVPRPVPADIQEVYAIYDDYRSPSEGSAGSLTAELTSSGQADRTGVPSRLSTWAHQVQSGIDATRLREAIIMSEVLSPPVSVRRSPSRTMPPPVGIPGVERAEPPRPQPGE